MMMIKKYYLLIALLVLGSSKIGLFGQCISTPVQYNQNTIERTNFHAPHQRVWYAITKKSFYKDPEFTIENISLGDSSFVAIYDSLHCDSFPNDFIVKTTLQSGENPIDLDSLTEDVLYYLVVYSDYSGRGAFRLTYSGTYDVEGCHQEVNRTNSILRPQILHPAAYSVNQCFGSCNRYVRNQPSLYDYRHQPDTDFKWYQIDTSFHSEFLCVNAFSSDDDFEVMIARKIEGDDVRVIYKDTSDFLGLNIEYLPTPSDADILIGIRPLNDQIFDFSLCYKVMPEGTSCIDYLIEGDTLYPVSASLGSDVQGPYKEGEEIEFVYRINQWRPINHAWLHSLTPTWNGPWQLKKDTILVDSAVAWSLTDENGPKENWTWMYEDSVNYFSVLNYKFQGPSWYIQYNENGPQGMVPKMLWGERLKYHTPAPSPYIQLSFTMVVDDSLDCEGLNVCDVSVKANTDIESGYYFSEGCVNTAEMFACTTECCTNMPLVELKDPTICDNRELFIEVSGLEKGSGTLEIPGLLTSRGLKEGTNRIYLSSGADRLSDYDLKFQFQEGYFCRDTASLPFQIAPEPRIELGDRTMVCPGGDRRLQNEKYNHEQTLSYAWSEVGNTTFDHEDDSEQYYLDHIYDPTMVVLQLTNEFGCYARDSTIVDVYRTQDRVLADIALCAQDLDSIVHIDPVDDRCTSYFILPNGDRVRGEDVRLLAYGKYYYISQCTDGCGVMDSFHVKRWAQYDTVYVRPSLMSDISDFAYLEDGLSRNTTRSSEEGVIPCDYKKDTVYLLDPRVEDLPETSALSIYPNPSQGEVTLVNRTKYSGSYMVVDMQGQVWFEGGMDYGGVPRSLQGLQKGVYYIIFTYNHQTSIQKLIVNE